MEALQKVCRGQSSASRCNCLNQAFTLKTSVRQ
jgi:hypothetical protein